MGDTAGNNLRFRPDIEGLRAVAVLMVLFYHLGLQWAPGGFAGVDVFFVISGFLITSQLVREVEATGAISIVGFYSRRAKRLFPAAILVLVATFVLSYLLLPATRWRETGGDIFAAAGYFINWRLAARAVDYLAEDSVPSIVQHYWSLAVEEQYYLVWPLALLAGLSTLRRLLPSQVIMWVVLTAVALPSLAWSIYLTSEDRAAAYFITSTRMWELAIGGALAILGARLKRIPSVLGMCLGWSGLLAIIGTMAFLTVEMAWPGYLAAVPTLGAAAIIAGGHSPAPWGVSALLAKRPLVFIGGISYALYLWHWPVIEFARAPLGELRPTAMLVLAAGSIALAWATARLVENPVRYSRSMGANPKYALSFGLNLTLIGLLAGIGLVLAAYVNRPHEDVSGAETQREALGARLLRANPRNDPAGAPVDRVDWITPDPALAVNDVPAYYTDGCRVEKKDAEPKPCTYGDPKGLVTVALVGDSKAGQWLPALDIIAKKNRWRLVVNVKSACGFTSSMIYISGKPYETCYQWNRTLIQQLLGQDGPDYVITSIVRSRTDRKEDPKDAIERGLADWWQRLESEGIHVVALADNPHPGMRVYECVEKNRERLTECTFKRRAGAGTSALKAAAKRVPGVDFIDLTSAICPTSRCAPIIGNVLIYRQGSHVTTEYMKTLVPRLERRLKAAGVGESRAKRPPAQEK